jgi:hypothetical protein
LQGSLTATVTSTGSTSTVPGYTGQTSTDQSQYFSNPSALAGAGASAAQSSNAYAVVTEQRSTTIDPKSINLSTAQAIAADPSSVGAISTAGSGASGSCQTVQATAGNTGTYYDSCQIGSTEQDAAFTCTVGWRDVVATTTTYSCEQKVVSGINGGQATTVATLDSCTQLAAVSTCSKAGSSSVSGAEHYGVAGSGSIYQPPRSSFLLYGRHHHQQLYLQPGGQCRRGGFPTLTDWTGTDATGAPVLGNVTVTANATQTGSSAKLVSSTVDDSACQAQVGTITCATGSTLQNGQCVSTVSATLVYSCPAGWSLAGTTCTLASLHRLGHRLHLPG